jgi:single-strand DNA-binding protein
MSASINECTFIGNVGNDPEIRQAGDKQVASWNIACSKTWKDADGNRQEKTNWIPCVAWGATATIVQQYLRKGSQVWVRGAMETREWEDKEGVKRYKTEIIVERLQLLGKRDNSGQEQGAAGGYGGRPAQGAGYGGQRQQSAQGSPAGRYGGASGNPTDYQGGQQEAAGDDPLPF